MNAQNGHLDIGGVFDSTTEIYKNCFGTVWIVALVLLIPANIIVALLGNGILGIIGSLISLAASAWLMGSIIKIVQDVEADGRVDMSVGEILGAVWPRIIPIILLEIVVGILNTAVVGWLNDPAYPLTQRLVEFTDVIGELIRPRR